MLPDDRIRLQHMLDAAQEAITFANGLDQKGFVNDRMRLLSVVKSIEIIGEAATKVSPTLKQQANQIPWDDIKGMRNRLIHAYFDINMDVVWQTVKTDLPALIPQLKKLLESK
jgi:uncharacterized protein with HEPN domain